MRKNKEGRTAHRKGAGATRWLSRLLRLVLWLLLLCLLLVVFVFVGLPRVALWAASSWYAQQGEGYQLQVSDWTFKPLQGELALHGLLLQHPTADAAATAQQTQLNRVAVQLDVEALRAGQLRVRHLHIDGLDVALQQRQATMQIAGLTIPLQESEVESDHVDTANAADEGNDQPTPLALRIDDLALTSLALHWHIEQGELDAESPLLALSGVVVLDYLHLQHWDTLAFETVPVSWQFTLPALQVTQPVVFGLQQPLVWQFDGEWQGGLVSPLLEGQSIIDAFDVSMTGAPSVSFSRLMLDGIHLSLTEQRVRELSLSDLLIGEAEQPLLALAHYHVDDIELSEQSLSTGLHGFAGLHLHLERMADGGWAGVPTEQDDAQIAKVDEAMADSSPIHDAIEEMDENDELALAKSQPEDSTEPLLLRLAGVTQLSSDGLIVFRDRTTQPAVSKDIRIQQLQVESIQLDTDSLQLRRPLVWHVQMTLDDFTRIDWDGTLTALDADADVTMTLVVRQLDLVSFNAYITPILGYRLQRGLLDVDLDVAVNKGVLSGELALRLRNSRFEAVDERAIRRLSQQIAMPVETALSLLRDENNVVRLTIPLSGSLNDPDIGLGDLTRQLSRLAVQSAAGFYLRQSLQPYSTLVSLASYAGSELLAIRLQAIAFDALSSELDVEAQAYLTKVADIMHGKPNLQLRVCPFVSVQEVALLAENKDEDAITWTLLAQQRGRVVRQFLAPLQDRDERPLFERVSICVPQQGNRAEVVLGF